ncbi:MAG: heavy-metal-associated domain-containing protein [Deltaproteobacteria bacterium]|nr:heavy-metal-associated domain-containing protein [Deltaproteobacteria bacterium]
MKKALVPILLSVAVVALAAAGSPLPSLLPSLLPQARAQAAEAHASLHVEGMHCASCSVTVRAVLRRLDGVTDVAVSAADKRARVAYYPRRITPERMARAVTDAGYPTTVEPANDR